jgi:hypothetical protein
LEVNWIGINENSLNKQIKDEIKDLKINDFTKPINRIRWFFNFKNK